MEKDLKSNVHFYFISAIDKKLKKKCGERREGKSRERKGEESRIKKEEKEKTW